MITSGSVGVGVALVVPMLVGGFAFHAGERRDDSIADPTNIASVNLVMGCSKVSFSLF